ncbi:hypothetical protein CEXT_633371 [Caerostris extrusa]|uniref:Uncharacterized protein n=1 Tax=Caerostris extrusa TaxID=172846 RepID=A0AAV4PQH1_CAEEX|nr:hypothetical protein CEXT_633371 [Caerostris extrusa]
MPFLVRVFQVVVPVALLGMFIPNCDGTLWVQCNNIFVIYVNNCEFAAMECVYVVVCAAVYVVSMVKDLKLKFSYSKTTMAYFVCAFKSKNEIFNIRSKDFNCALSSLNIDG